MPVLRVPRLALFSAATLVLLVCGTASTSVAQLPPLDFELDHFLVYKVENMPLNEHVGLSDQFNEQFEDAVLENLTHFANPTRKNQEEIQHPTHHLSWYRLAKQEPEPRRRIRFRNQFGFLQQIVIRNARFLLAPAGKNNPDIPTDLDHYRCYEVVRVDHVPELPTVHLVDQFPPPVDVQVRRPVFFCAPCNKMREGQHEIDIQNAEDHLTIYRLPRQDLSQAITAVDQFGTHSLIVQRRVFLAVPTKKGQVKVLDQ